MNPRARLIEIAKAGLGTAQASPPDRSEDWIGLIEESKRNGMAPLVCGWALSERQGLDRETEKAIRSLIRQIGVSSLVLSQLLLKAARICEADHIPFLFWKGPVLATQLYGDAARRQYGDIDIIVPACEVVRLHRALQGQGFRPLYDLTEPQLRWLQTISGENCYLDRTNGLALDVHWSLVTPRVSFGGGFDQFSQGATTVQVGSEAVPCPSLEWHLVMLAIHGTKHAWSSLGWIYDFAHACQKPGLDWTAVWQAARATSSERMLTMAIGLCREVFDLPLPEPATRQLEHASLLRWAARISGESRMAVPAFCAAMPGLRNRASYLKYLFLDPTTLDFELVRLPETLFPLYYAVRPVRLAAKHLFGVRQRRRG